VSFTLHPLSPSHGASFSRPGKIVYWYTDFSLPEKRIVVSRNIFFLVLGTSPKCLEPPPLRKVELLPPRFFSRHLHAPIFSLPSHPRKPVPYRDVNIASYTRLSMSFFRRLLIKTQYQPPLSPDTLTTFLTTDSL